MSKRLPLLQQILEANPDDSFALFAIAKEFEGMNDLQQAQHFYQRLLMTNPGYVGLYYHLGKLYEKLGQPAVALQTYRDGMGVARQAGDMHAFGELNTARLELDDAGDDI